MGEGAPEQPVYRKVVQADSRNSYMIMCDEGWRTSVVCTGMYEWAADWLLAILQGRPYAPGRRP